MPNVRAFMVLNHIQPLGEVLGTNPGGRALLEQDYGLSFELVLASTADPSEIEHAVSAVMEVDGVSIEQIEPDETQGPDATATLHLTTRQVAGGGTGRNARQTFSVRVGTDRLDRALIVASELAVLHRYLIAGRAGGQQADLEVDLARATAMADELQDILTEARLVPVEDVFRRFPRMVRDLAKQRGRQVRLDISGAETVLDRVMIDDLGDALVHLLRNAIDHGIESPAARQAAGKAEQGVVTLAAYHDGEDVVVEVRDDGAGIDVNVVRRSAIEQGVLSAQDAAELSEEETLDLAFVPGLTTAPTVTELSGRGFGMDIVRAKLAQLDGSVHISSELGQGTVTTLRVPKRLASALPRSMRH
jgi:two-component system chemotaxis sensor kinase CheA